MGAKQAKNSKTHRGSSPEQIMNCGSHFSSTHCWHELDVLPERHLAVHVLTVQSVIWTHPVSVDAGVRREGCAEAEAKTMGARWVCGGRGEDGRQS